MRYRYAGVIAINPNTDRAEVVKSATGTVHINEDWDSPVVVQDPNGFDLTTLNTTVEGLFPDFYVEDQAVVGFKTSSGHRFYLRSSTPVPGPAGPIPTNVTNSEGNLVFEYPDGTDVPGPPMPTPDGLADGEIASLVQDTQSATGAAVEQAAAGAAQGAVGAEADARRKAIRAGSPTPLSSTIKIPLPTTGGLNGSGFTWQDAPISVYGVNGAYSTDFDPEGLYPIPEGTTYYVDTVNGAQANDGLTPATAKSNMQFAYQAASSGDTIMILDEGPLYRSGGWQDTKITKSIRIKAAHPGVVLACADKLTYTLTAGATYTYQSARSNVNKVVDMDLYWAPDGYAYKQVTGLTEAEATPGSWYTDGTNVFVRTIDGSKPDSKRILALLNAQHFYTESSGAGNMHVYMEGIRVLGGSHGMLVNAHTHKVSFYAKDCAFVHSASLGEASANGASFAGTERVYLRNVRTLGSKKDGFNYTAYNVAGALKDAPKVIEVDCEAYEHGLTGAYNDTCNASTGHAGAKIIRVNCKGHHTRGAVFADVQTGTQSVNFGCTGWDSLSASTGSRSIFHAQQAGADMWLYGCEAFGADWDVYANTGTWIGARGSIYGTTNGGGTIALI